MRLISFTVLLLTLISCGSFSKSNNQGSRILLNGETIPNTKLQTIEGKTEDFYNILKEGPSVVVFYRGGWCPYCNRQLQGLRKITKRINKKGYQLLAISPDKPENLKKTLTKEKLKYKLYSDSELNLAKALGISFKLDDKTYQEYLEYGINLEEASGKKHHSLPMPAVYIVDKKGMIHFSYINPNYAVRLNEKVLMSAIRHIKLNKK